MVLMPQHHWCRSQRTRQKGDPDTNLSCFWHSVRTGRTSDNAAILKAYSLRCSRGLGYSSP
ncbi:hypothetical protein IscW_ISCW006287 [Ixodes scapularis]|uniref:Uncharacterized protein n=1 Tax=Ixodes scapularis TaxID=6945 RepID=B7PNH1_IXOSC|nr:hypothetical protein IscW_ISCW006287 [Ixodes scapularis]|eukprot:XP_002435319.1 hypothetical protein IscW_ISCW006287 [Ixodes scapularis]